MTAPNASASPLKLPLNTKHVCASPAGRVASAPAFEMHSAENLAVHIGMRHLRPIDIGIAVQFSSPPASTQVDSRVTSCRCACAPGRAVYPYRLERHDPDPLRLAMGPLASTAGEGMFRHGIQRRRAQDTQCAVGGVAARTQHVICSSEFLKSTKRASPFCRQSAPPMLPLSNCTLKPFIAKLREPVARFSARGQPLADNPTSCYPDGYAPKTIPLPSRNGKCHTGPWITASACDK